MEPRDPELYRIAIQDHFTLLQTMYQRRREPGHQPRSSHLRESTPQRGARTQIASKTAMTIAPPTP